MYSSLRKLTVSPQEGVKGGTKGQEYLGESPSLGKQEWERSILYPTQQGVEGRARNNGSGIVASGKGECWGRSPS